MLRSRLVPMLALLGASMSLSGGPPQVHAGPERDAGSDAGSSAPPAGAGAEELDAWLKGRIDGLIGERENLAEARIGIYIKDLGDDRLLYQRAAEDRYNVASNTKLFTSAAALSLLGPGFRYQTAVAATAVDDKGTVEGDLYILGRGDPSLETADLESLAADLARAGITSVRGSLIIDSGHFDAEVSPPHFDEQPDEQAAFRAPVAALSLDRNAFAVVIRPERGGRAWAVIEPQNDHVHLRRNDLVSQADGRERILLSSEIVRGRIEVDLGGQIRADSPVRRFRRRVADPETFAASAFRTILAARGIRVRGRRIKRAEVPEDARVLASVRSEPLAVLIRALGKKSDNFVAETVLKTLGAERRPADASGPATWDQGLSVVRSFLGDEIGLAAGSFRYDNGSGLFDSSEFSPAQLVALLATAYRDPRYGADFVSSLAIAGVDGTLRRRMGKSPGFAHVRGKTGTLATVSALSGYAMVDGMRPIAFSIIVNDMPPEGGAKWRAKKEARSLQNQIADALVQYARASGAH